MSSRRPGHWLRRLVVTVVVLGVLAVAVDRAAAWVAENQLATMAENEAAQYDVRAADTSVKIGGVGGLPPPGRGGVFGGAPAHKQAGVAPRPAAEPKGGGGGAAR